jgi:hypothetical protein
MGGSDPNKDLWGCADCDNYRQDDDSHFCDEADIDQLIACPRTFFEN